LKLRAKYRLTDGGSSGFALIGGMKFPTGSTHKRDAEAEHASSHNNHHGDELDERKPRENNQFACGRFGTSMPVSD
jgi:hypothetical protein